MLFATADGLISPSILLKLTCQTLTEKEISLNFLLEVCSTLKSQRSSSSLVEALKKGGIHELLADFFPANQRDDNKMKSLFTNKGFAEVASLHGMKETKRKIAVVCQLIFESYFGVLEFYRCMSH